MESLVQKNLSGRLFLLDKPPEGMDMGAKTEFYRLISKLADRGASVLLVSVEWDELIN